MLLGLASIGAILLGFTEALRIYGPKFLLGERGAIELTQLGLLLASLFVLGWSPRHRSLRTLVVPLMLLLGAVTIRELDAALDLIVHGLWKYPAWTMALAALLYVARHRNAAVEAFERIRHRRTMGLFVSAAFVVLVQSRLLGRQVVWESALGEEYLRMIPRLVEELTELVGYGLLLLACVDLAPAKA